MDSSESNEKQTSRNSHEPDSVPPKLTSDSNIKIKSPNTSSNPSSANSARKDIFHKSDTSSDESDSQQEKGQRESSGHVPTEKSTQLEDSSAPQKQRSSPYDDAQSDDSEPEPEEDPPEYNVKERLVELNAELAMEPDPNNRQHRVGFKEELVDLVAPPPEVETDEETPRKPKEGGGDGDKGKDKYVIERDGKFEVLAPNELTESERSILNLSDEDEDKNKGSEVHHKHSVGVDHRSQDDNHSHQPAPPSKPRPATANGNSRRNVHPVKTQRPQTASDSRSSNSTSMLQNTNYTSSYAMEAREKEKAQERARQRDERRKKQEDRRKQEEEYKQQEADECFQAWLQKKREEKKNKQEERTKIENKEDKSEDSESDDSESKENEEAYYEWLKKKHSQNKKEKLLKKREDQETKDGFYVRSREECDKAYREWLKKKYAELKEKKTTEKQRHRSYKIQARRARKQMMMARAVRQAQAFSYVDYYGYRF